MESRVAAGEQYELFTEALARAEAQPVSEVVRDRWPQRHAGALKSEHEEGLRRVTEGIGRAMIVDPLEVPALSGAGEGGSGQ